jgi:hypothetical protein
VTSCMDKNTKNDNSAIIVVVWHHCSMVSLRAERV